MRKINNRQKLRVMPPPNPIARLLPKFKPQVIRNRVKYTRKGRQAHPQHREQSAEAQ